LVEKMASWPAFGPEVGRPTVQKLWAIAADGLTVEAFGGLCPLPGKTVR
jgi:hypothetical protein